MWEAPDGCGHTLLLLPDEIQEEEQELETILREAPSVLLVTADQLCDMLQVLVQEE